MKWTMYEVEFLFGSKYNYCIYLFSQLLVLQQTIQTVVELENKP